jgi:magnesium chelatase subunit I
VPRFTEELVAEITLQARSSPDVNQTSGVSVRMSISNQETLVANALRRALRSGEREAVPRISDLDALVQSTAGKLELEYAGEAKSDADVVRDLIKRATRVVFDAWVPIEAVAPVAEAFQQGWVVEVSSGLPSAEYLQGLDEIRGLREVAARLAGGDSPARIAAGIEFVLEGLHLRNRLNKTTSEGGSRYARA